MRNPIRLVCLLGLLALFVPAAAAADPLERDHVPGQLLVKFQSGTEREIVDVINAQLGGQIARSFRGDVDLRLVALPEREDLRFALAFYAQQPEVVYAQPDYLLKIQVIPDDTRFGELWGMHNDGQSGGLVDFDIDGPEGWDVNSDASQVIIGSIDTGIDIGHVDLSNVWQNDDPVNGVDDDNNGFIDDVNGWNFVNNTRFVADDNSHGTHTMGSATAQGGNSEGVAGAAWNAQIMPIKVCNSFGSCPTSAIIGGIDYATQNGAHLTSNSYGGGGFNQATKDAIDRAEAAGVLFVAAAGNNGRNTDANPFYPASYDNANIISVANMTRFGSRSSSSNYGLTTVDLGAPGSSILSTTPGSNYGTKSGTSMACPHVAGVVANIMGYNPNLLFLDYKQIVLDSAVPNDAMSGRSTTGGVLNLREALNLTPPPVIPEENDPPTADAGGPYKGRAFRAITFDGSGSTDPDDVELGDFVSSYTWDFGDGTVTTTSSPTVTHSYGAGNNDYVVTLTVRDKYRVASQPSTSTCRIRGGGRKPPKK